MNDPVYDQKASAYSRKAIVIWCLVGWTYGAITWGTWNLFWLQGILIFFPGIFVASLIAAASFIPFWLALRKESIAMTVFAVLLKVVGFATFVAAPILYVRLLHHFLVE